MTTAMPQRAAKNGAAERIPDERRLVKLDDVCVRFSGTRDPRAAPDQAFTYVDISSVDNRLKRITEPKRLLGKDAPSRARQVIRANDVLVATTRPNLNAVAFVAPELDGQICSTGFCVLRSNGEIEPEFLFAFVQADEFVSSLTDLVKGALYPAVTDKQVRAQGLPLPPLAQQRRIAARLRKQLAEVAQARAAIAAQLAAAQALPSAHLRAVFNGAGAKEWPRRKLCEVCELLPSKSIASAGDAEVRAVTSACLSEEGFLPSGVKTAQMWAKDVPACVMRPGEILVARSNTPELVGRVSIFAGEPAGVVAADLTIRLWAGYDVKPEFLSGYLSFLYLTGYWRERAGGASSTMKKITRGQLAMETIPLPAIEVQEVVAEQIESEITSARNLRQTLSARLAALDQLPAALLREAFASA